MNNEETQMPDDDRFVLRRGTQGDDWRPSDGAPEPEPPRSNPLARLGSAIGAAGSWLRARLGGLRSLGGRMRRSGEVEEAALEQPSPEEPGHGWAPMPPLPEDPRVAVPWSQVAPARPKLPSFRERFVTNRQRVAIPWSKIALSRPKIGEAKPAKVSAAKVSTPKLSARKLPSLSAPRPKLPVPHLPRVSAPRMPKMRAPIITFSGLAGIRLSSVREDMKGPLAVFAGLALASLIALGAILTIETIGDGDGGALVIATETPEETEVPQVTPTATPEETTAPTEAPVITDEPTATEAPATDPPTAAPTARPTAGPTTRPTAAPTARPTAAPGGGSAAASAPQGGVGVGYWSNKLNRWWFGDLTDESANYEEGEDIPFMVRWEGTAGVTYSLRIVFDCQTPDTFGTLDYLSGVESYGGELATAKYGPGNMQPDSAIPVPDTTNFDPDDGDTGVFWLWGAKFPVLPLPPHPDDNCDFLRTQDIPIQAFGGPIIFLASGHLGTATVYDSGEGASTAAYPFGLHITVDGVGHTDVMIDPSGIADVER